MRPYRWMGNYLSDMERDVAKRNDGNAIKDIEVRREDSSARAPVAHGGIGQVDPPVPYRLLDSMPIERPTERGLGLGELISAVRRRKWMVAATALVFAIGAAA